MAERGGLQLYGILVAGLVLRIAWGMHLGGGASVAGLPDQQEYLSIGENLVHSGTLKFHDGRFDQDVYAYRTPGYPLFVALCGASSRVIQIAQAILDTLTIAAIYRIAAGRLDRRAGLLSAAIIAFNPWLIYFTGLILSETLFTAILAWSILLLLRQRGWVWGCVLLAIAALVRPSAGGLCVLLPLAAAFLNRTEPGTYQSGTQRLSIPKWLLAPATGFICVVLILFPWAYRNHRVVGAWIWTTTNSGITLYDGFNPIASGASDQSFTQSMPELASMNEVQRSDYLSSLAHQYVENHPERIVSLTWDKIRRTWSPKPLSTQFSNSRNVLIAEAYTIPYFLLVLAGLWLSGLNWRVKILLLTPAVYFTIVHAMSVGSIRYRIPADPPMAVLAGGVLASGFRSSKSLTKASQPGL